MVKQLLLILLLAVSGWSATGDIVSVSIDTSGWFAHIAIEGLDTNGTYNLGDSIDLKPNYAKMQFTVSSEGYNASLVRSKHSRIVYGTKSLRNVYPYEADYADTLIGGNVVCKIALSSAIFERDSFITVNIGSGFYTQGIESNNSASDLSVTNNSNAEYPKVIGNWSYPGQSVVTGNFTVRGCFAHYSAEQGKMIQGVKFTATDEHSNTFTSSVLNPIFSNDSIIEFFDTIDVSGFTVGDKITVNWTAYPIWGDSLYTGDGVNTWPTPKYCPQYYKYIADRYCAVVDPSQADNTTGQTALHSTFNPASPPPAFKDMFAAINAIRVAMGTADISGGIVYLRNGNHTIYGDSMTAGTVANYWLELRSFPNESPVINAKTSGANLPVNSYVKAQGIEFQLASGSVFNSETGIWIDSCIDNNTSGILLETINVTYLTNSVINGGQNLPYSNLNAPVALIRGCELNFSYRIVPYMVIGCRASTHTDAPTFVSFYTGMTATQSDNVFIGFNKIARNERILELAQINAIGHGIALVQNIFEKTTTVNNLGLLAGDKSISPYVYNVLLFHNTIMGERLNHAYNDHNLNGLSPLPRLYWSLKNNIFGRTAIVKDDDTHNGDPDGVRTGGWSVVYGNGTSGNVTIGIMSGFKNEFFGFKSKFGDLDTSFSANSTVQQNYIKFVADKSYTGTGTGNGDYHLTEGSEAIGNAYDWVLPYDLDGNQRYSGGAAGAYEYIVPVPTITSISPSSPRLFKTFEATGTNLSNCKLYLNSVSLGAPASATSTSISDTALGTTRGFHWLIAEDTLTGMRCSTSSRIYIKNTQLDTVLLGRP